MIDDKDIVEVEVVESTIDEKPQTDVKPQRATSDKRNQILLWGGIANFCFRYGFPLALIGGFAGLAFAIVYGEGKQTFQLVLMIIAFTMAGLGVLTGLFGIVARVLMVRYMRQDPNFEDQV